MNKRTWKQDLNEFNGLENIRLLGVPMRSSRKGPVIDLEANVLERRVARAVIGSRTPIRGKEVRFLRNTIGLSLDKFGRELGLTSTAIFYWEKASEERLLPINTVAVRAFAAQELGVDVPGSWSALRGNSTPETITLEISRTRKTYKPRSKKREADSEQNTLS